MNVRRLVIYQHYISASNYIKSVFNLQTYVSCLFMVLFFHKKRHKLSALKQTGNAIDRYFNIIIYDT